MGLVRGLRGGIHWERIPGGVQAAIKAVKRHKLGPAESGRGRPSIEAEDTEVIDPSDLMRTHSIGSSLRLAIAVSRRTATA